MKQEKFQNKRLNLTEYSLEYKEGKVNEDAEVFKSVRFIELLKPSHSSFAKTKKT